MTKTCEIKLKGSQKQCQIPAKWVVSNIKEDTSTTITYTCEFHVNRALSETEENEVLKL